ncbi:hypothetical protein COBT_000952 [Conglomerata obtusa]
MKILISGTPGVGKTTIAKKLASTIMHDYYDISAIIIQNDLYSKKDKQLDTHVFSTRKVKKFLKKHITSENIIIETHTPECVTFIEFDCVFVLRTNLKVLKERLLARNYSDEKIKKNIEAEIYNEIGYDCMDHWLYTYIIYDNEGVKSVDEIICEIQRISERC